MVSLNTLRTKYAVVLLFIMAGAIIAFIFSLGFDYSNPFANNNPDVGEINGESISYQEFSKAYEETKLQMGGETNDYAQAVRMISNTWQSLVADHVLTPSFEKLGIAVTESEFNAILQGEINSSILASIFADQKTGAYNPQLCNEFLARAESDAQVASTWALIKKQIRFERAVSKYADLVRGGEYANTLTVNENLTVANNTYSGRFVTCKYYTVADSLVSVSTSEMKSYYKANKEQFKQTPYRTVKYTTFSIEPTEEDKALIEQEAKALAEKFKKTKDIDALLNESYYVQVEPNFVTAKNLGTNEIKVLRTGRAYGPLDRGDDWYASRVVETRDVPENFELEQIVVKYGEDKLADSLIKVARRGANFAALAEKHSIIGSSEIGEVLYKDLSEIYANALRNARRGSIVKVTTNNAIQIFKVKNTGSITRHYRLATMTYPIEASEATKNTILGEAGKFSTEVADSAKKFDEVVEANSLPYATTEIALGSRQFDDLEEGIDVVRWANKADEGDVSEIFSLKDCYVVAVLTKIDDNKYKSFEEVKDQIKNKLIKTKKCEYLKAKMTGASLEEIAENCKSRVEKFNEVRLSPYYLQNIGPEPRVAGALSAVGKEQVGTILPIIEGATGAYILIVDDIHTADEPQTFEAERVKEQAQTEGMAVNRAMFAIQQEADVEDNTILFF